METIYNPTPPQLQILAEIDRAERELNKRKSDIASFMCTAANVELSKIQSLQFDGQKVVIIHEE